MPRKSSSATGIGSSPTGSIRPQPGLPAEDVTAAFENIPDAVVVLNSDLRVLYANASALALTAHPDGEIRDVGFHRFLSSRELERVVEIFRSLLSRERAMARFEMEIGGLEGRKRKVEATAAAAAWAGEAAITLILRDVIRGRETSGRAADAMSILLVDREGLIHYANAAAEVDAGAPPEDLVGRVLGEVFPSALVEEQLSGLRSALDTGEPWAVFTRVNLNGRQEFREIRIQPFRGPLHLTEAALIVMMDRTEETKQRDRVLDYQARLRAFAMDQALADQRERRVLSVALHDRISQTLAFTKMELDSVRAQLASAPLGARLDEILLLLGQAIDDARSLMFQISPPVLHELGLAPALEWLADRLQAQHRIPIRVTDDSLPKPLDSDTAGLVFLAARELLMNVIAHSEASNAEVSLRREDGWLRLDVVDDGKGLDTETMRIARRQGAHFGLFAIRERLRQMGGRLLVRSRSGGGTKVSIVVPLEPRTENPQ